MQRNNNLLTLQRGSRPSSTCEERNKNNQRQFLLLHSRLQPYCDLLYSLSILRVQCTEYDRVDIVVPPEEEPERQPEEGVYSEERVSLQASTCWCVELTSSGCRWGWFPERTPWSGPRWRRVEGWSSGSCWWLSAPPGRLLATPSPRSTGTTRYRLWRGRISTFQLHFSVESIITRWGEKVWSSYGCAHS